MNTNKIRKALEMACSEKMYAISGMSGVRLSERMGTDEVEHMKATFIKKTGYVDVYPFMGITKEEEIQLFQFIKSMGARALTIEFYDFIGRTNIYGGEQIELVSTRKIQLV